MRLVARVLMVLAIAAVAGLTVPGGGAARAAETIVEVDDFYFCGEASQGGICETKINAGDTVRWEVEGGTHTVTECDDSFSTCPPSGGFGSGNLSTGGEFSHTFAAAGSYEYRCNLHPGVMRGRIAVVARITPTPVPTGTPGATVGPTEIPAAVPASGGPPDGSSGLPWGFLLAGTGAIVLSGSFGLALRSRRS